MATWRKMIIKLMKVYDECWDDIVANTMTDEETDTEFDAGFGGSEGCPFTLWTVNRVYFPVVYDGSEWVGSVPRNPCQSPSGHFGGE